MNDKPMTRRDFFKTSAWASALFAATPFWATDLDEPMPTEYLASVPANMPFECTTPADLANTDPAVLVLNRIAFGPRSGDVEHVRAIGVDAYIEQQLAPETIDDAAVSKMLGSFPSLTMEIQELAKYYVIPFGSGALPNENKPAVSSNGSMDMAGQMDPTMNSMDGMQIAESKNQSILELIQATILRQVYSERQLFEVMVDFWSNHFNIYALKKQCRVLKTWDDRVVIRSHALGKFRDLLFASATSPAMLIYLDNLSNVKGVPQENYARELMELHTLGLNSGYTQADVENVARAFTGWSLLKPPRTVGVANFDEETGGFMFRAYEHDDGPKRILGVQIPANGGQRDGERVLEILATHPKTAEHLAFKLVRRFVDDNPPALLVAQAADTFLKTDGDIRAVLSTILHSDEFKTSFGKKVKRPIEFVASALRTLERPSNADLNQVPLKNVGPIVKRQKQRTDEPLANVLRVLGQVPFLWQSPNGYPDVAGAWVNSNNLLSRWNLALALANNAIDEFDIALISRTKSASPEAMVDEWTERVLHRALPAPDREKLIAYVRGDKSKTRLANLVALLIASPHFQYR